MAFGYPTNPIYSNEEILAAQAAIDSHPNGSPFWDTEDGQEAIRISKLIGLKAQTTNKQRAATHAAGMRQDHFPIRQQIAIARTNKLTDGSETHDVLIGSLPNQVEVSCESQADADAMHEILQRAGFAIHIEIRHY